MSDGSIASPIHGRIQTGGGGAAGEQWPTVEPDCPGAGDSSCAAADLAAENARLRRENERLRMEREILKKTLRIFSEAPK